MTSVSPSNGSTSPRWDSRNQGFISPAQLQQWRQQQQRNATHEYPPSPPPAPQRESQEDVHPVPNRPAPPPASNPPTTGGHSRSMSAFSLFNRGRQSHEGTHDSGHPPPSGSAQPPAHRHDEFGAPQPSQQRGPSLDASSPPPASALNRASTSSYPTIMRTSTDSSSPALHPEIRSIVQLTVAHGRKVYYSGPLVRRVERQPDGQTPTKDDGWRDVWAQLGGTTLSVWDMKAIDEASKEGRQVPPTYVNVTDAFVNVLGAVTVPATPTSPPKKYGNVLTLNTAGSNLLLFSCPSPGALMSWAAAVRLSAWEKSRLEEIYTAHLIRITLNDGRHWPTPLTHGRMEGWVGIRVAGQTDWKRMWMVVTAGGHSPDGSSVSSTDQTNPPGSPNAPSVLRKKRMSNLFSRDRSPQRTVAPTKPFIQLLASPKPKDRKKPLLTMRDLTQAFAVYPERPDLISRSTLMKMEGTLGDEDVGSSMKSRECWLLVMPEFEGANSRASEMLKWLIGIHDAFELYGRPHEYIWDPRDPRSMMFAYPIGPHRDLLFLDREFAEGLDVLDERTSSVRLQLQNILLDRMRNPGSGPGEPVPPSHDHAPVLPPLHEVQSQENQEAEQPQPRRERFSLPPLNFDGPLSGSNNGPPVPEKRVLTPITERSVRDTSRSLSGDNPLTGTSTGRPTTPSTVAENSEETGIIAGQPLTTSPVDTGPSSHADTGKRLSEDSHGVPPNARADSRLSHLTHGRAQSQASLTHPTAPQPANMNLPIASEPDAQSLANRPRNASPPAMSSPTTSSDPSSSVRVQSPRPTYSGTEQSSVYSQASQLQPSPTTSTWTSLKQSLPSPPAPVARTTAALVNEPLHQQPKPPHPVPPAPLHVSRNPAPPPQAHPPPTQQLPQPPQNDDESDMLGDSHVLHYMRQMDEESGHVPVHRYPPPAEDDEEESQESSDYEAYVPPPRATTSALRTKCKSPPPAAASPASTRRAGSASVTSTASSQTNVSAAPSTTASRSAVIRKPSGARAAPASKMPGFARNSFALNRSPDEHVEHLRNDMADGESDLAYARSPPNAALHSMPSFEDPNADALAALSFLEQEDAPAKPTLPPPPPPPAASPRVPSIVEPSPNPSSESVDKQPYRSSFAPSKQAAERKAKTQAQQAAHHAAVSRPGKANGRKVSNQESRGWAESSEEEEEEEEEDEDADSDGQPPPRMQSRSEQYSGPGSASASIAGRPGYPPSRGASPAADANAGGYPQGQRRELPQLPGQRFQGGSDDYLGGPPRRLVSDQYSEAGRRSYHQDGSRPPPPGSIRPPSEYPQAQFQPQPQLPRQNMWSQVLDPGRSQGGPPEPASGGNRDTFVQIEPPSQTMTKAFTPHGLLSAGLQDRQDRSAKRQEELARETGASLINVPNKPPPPQTGLLGAVTAHERERKRDGGIGATLTEREREKRMAEERQRKLDEFQRQQLDQMQQGGSMYGGMGMQGMQGFNPMMGMNPMMTGMNPMMTGGWGYPGMMPGFGSPQHMFAAQQAAMQAYQQAMMAFSAGGSPGEGQAPLNPMMTGGGMGMLDPRMSMMSLPMMSPAMGLNPGMGMGGGMGMGMTPNMTGGMSPGMGMGMGPMGMQQTGGSGFDPRFSPSAFEGLQPPDLGGPGPRPFSNNNSPTGRGSPAGPRNADPVDEHPRRTGDAS